VEPLKSRRISDTKFKKEFYDTLTPGVIPAAEFIAWDEVDDVARRFSDVAEFVSGLRVSNLAQEVRDTLLATDEPGHYLEGMFLMLGHTAAELAVRDGYFNIKEIAAGARAHDEECCEEIAGVLNRMGLPRLTSEDTLSLLKGVRIGLDTHRRKNIGGRQFAALVAPVLKKAVEHTSKKIRKALSLDEECRVADSEGNQKRCDFGINVEGKLKLALEVNFYTVSGSKPTEIRRAYANLRQWLNKAGKEIAWVTDGKGYYQMKSSLVDAFRLFPNIYNLRLLERHFANDLTEYLQKS